jgi:hypothetical protein
MTTAEAADEAPGTGTRQARRSLVGRNLLAGIEPDPAGDAGHPSGQPRTGFFTDTSVCIGWPARSGTRFRRTASN